MILKTILVLSLLCAVRAEYKFDTKWFTVPLDHFSYARNETFQMKYLENNDYWDRANGPIFFYTGNEGQIEVFARHTGFMWEAAAEFRAKLVFAEHRYYGASMPFGNKSLTREYIGFLSSEQALADYADLLDYLQGGGMKPKYPVVAFGGSYGGMLAAYIRMKYPHLVAGAIAASAPVHMYPGMVDCGVFAKISTSSFRVASNVCVDNINASWAIIRNKTSDSNNTLHHEWNLCEPVKNATDTQSLIDYLHTMYDTLAMVNYPFPSDFLVPLPGQPVRYVCQYLNETLHGEKLIEGIGKVVNVYANYDGKTKCVNYRDTDYGNLDASGWDFQACTEMVMPMCTNNSEDMYETSPWNFTSFAQECHDKYGVFPRENSAKVQYGGNNLAAASNIVFSNGLLDPWALGGILHSNSDSVVAVLILDGAHHLDLMPSTDLDPPTVRQARETHKQHIRQWVRSFYQTRR